MPVRGDFGTFPRYEKALSPGTPDIMTPTQEEALWNPLDDLSPEQRFLLDSYRQLLPTYNRRINLISKNTEPDILRRHILHSLFLGYKSFPSGSRVVDWGTGGGLPGIPLAIRFPLVNFVMIDATAKKISAVRAMVGKLKLKNIEVWNVRAEEWEGTASHSVSRATASLSKLWSWHERIAGEEAGQTEMSASEWPGGLMCLKGGALHGEIGALKTGHPSVEVSVIPICEMTPDPHFADKWIVHVFQAAENATPRLSQ